MALADKAQLTGDRLAPHVARPALSTPLDVQLLVDCRWQPLLRYHHHSFSIAGHPKLLRLPLGAVTKANP